MEDAKALLKEALQDNVNYVDATRLAIALSGDAMATNLFMLGYAYQRGLLPVSCASLLQAISLNGVAVDANVQAFSAGRLAAMDVQAFERQYLPGETVVFHKSFHLMITSNRVSMS